LTFNSLNNSDRNISIIDIEDVFIAELNSCGIIEVTFHDKTLEVQKGHLLFLKEAVFNLGNGKKMPLYINVTKFHRISSEARSYAASGDSSDFTLANAVLLKSLSNKLFFNFFLSINKPIVATKGFSKKEDALAWLISLKKISNSYN
jgi:hypothetical protein